MLDVTICDRCSTVILGEDANDGFGAFEGGTLCNDCHSAMWLDLWGKWDCPVCGKTHRDPNKVRQTCCGKCGSIVKLTDTNTEGWREAKPTGETVD